MPVFGERYLYLGQLYSSESSWSLLRSKHQIGETVLGRPIVAFQFSPPEYAKQKPPAILFGAIHGDEPLGYYCLQRLIEDLVSTPPGRETWIIPALNIDGLLAGSKNNANDVDLNRNFSATNWQDKHTPGYFPGKTPLSEPETLAVSQLIEQSNAQRLIALHSPFHVVNWDGSGKELAKQMAKHNGYPVSDNIGYPTPGSFGSKYGVDKNYEVVTLEIPMIDQEAAWQQNRFALRHALDLPTF